MNKYLQILLAVTLTVWTIIGVGVIVGLFVLINLETILGFKFSDTYNQFGGIKREIQYNCIVDKVGTESADKVWFNGEYPTKEFTEQVEPCFK